MLMNRFENIERWIGFPRVDSGVWASEEMRSRIIWDERIDTLKVGSTRIVWVESMMRQGPCGFGF